MKQSKNHVSHSGTRLGDWSFPLHRPLLELAMSHHGHGAECIIVLAVYLRIAYVSTKFYSLVKETCVHNLQLPKGRYMELNP